MINTIGFQYQFDEFNTLALRLTHVHAEVFYSMEFLVKDAIYKHFYLTAYF